jgi:hypothetical protein
MHVVKEKTPLEMCALLAIAFLRTCPLINNAALENFNVSHEMWCMGGRHFLRKKFRPLIL